MIEQYAGLPSYAVIAVRVQLKSRRGETRQRGADERKRN